MLDYDVLTGRYIRVNVSVGSSYSWLLHCSHLIIIFMLTC